MVEAAAGRQAEVALVAIGGDDLLTQVRHEFATWHFAVDPARLDLGDRAEDDAEAVLRGEVHQR